MMKLMLAGLGLVPLFSVHTPGQTNAFLYGLDTITYNIEMEDDDDYFTEDYLLSLPSVFNGSVAPVNFPNTYMTVTNPNNISLNTDVLQGMYFEGYQNLNIKGNDFFVSLTTPSEQSFHLLFGGDPVEDITYRITVDYDYIIPGWTEGSSVFWSQQYSSSLTFNGSTSFGVVYPLNWFIDNLPSYAIDEWYPIIHIKSFTCSVWGYVDSQYSDFMSLYIFDSYTYTNLMNTFSEEYLEYLNDEYYVEQIPPYDMIGWLSESLNGLWSMQIIPGMSIGSIVLTVVSILLAIVFIKFFAGG